MKSEKSEVQKSIDPVRYKYREWQWGIVIDDDFYTDRCGYRKQDFTYFDGMLGNTASRSFY